MIAGLGTTAGGCADTSRTIGVVSRTGATGTSSTSSMDAPKGCSLALWAHVLTTRTNVDFLALRLNSSALSAVILSAVDNWNDDVDTTPELARMCSVDMVWINVAALS